MQTPTSKSGPSHPLTSSEPRRSRQRALRSNYSLCLTLSHISIDPGLPDLPRWIAYPSMGYQTPGLGTGSGAQLLPLLAGPEYELSPR